MSLTAEESLLVEGDHVRLEQVVHNLLTNALKYTPSGGRVSVRLARRGEQAEIRVEDTGVGIDPQILPKVFDLFTQADDTLDRAHGGLGIGLTLVRSLVELHGGTVRAESPGRGCGSSFVVRVAGGRIAPRRCATPPSRCPPSTRAGSCSSRTTLDVRVSLQALLEDVGHCGDDRGRRRARGNRARHRETARMWRWWTSDFPGSMDTAWRAGCGIASAAPSTSSP